MKKKDEKKSINKELKRKKIQFVDQKWIIKIIILAFAISFVFSFLSEMIIPNVNVVIGIIILIIFILVGILFDIIGVSVQSADEKPFHSMNSRKIKGADIAVKFKKNADKVSSFCNDVVGDICGIISGTAASIIAVDLAQNLDLNKFIVILTVTALVSSLTIGGKALGKSFAVNKSNYILYEFAKIISHFYKIKK
ncbi:MAG: hypothetical protein PHN42_04195 [Bacilli bacterium]|nr:hypothetical protein [Bacilli bacterium]